MRPSGYYVVFHVTQERQPPPGRTIISSKRSRYTRTVPAQVCEFQNQVDRGALFKLSKTEKAILGNSDNQEFLFSQLHRAHMRTHSDIGAS
jgi:hypothetical protein